MVLLIITGEPVVADEALAKRCLTYWEDYQNIRLTGVVRLYAGNQVEEEGRFEFNIGEGKKGQLPPWEILLLSPNPGEPHIDTPFVVKEAWGTDGELSFRFERAYITKTPAQARLSSYFINATNSTGGAAYYVRVALLRGVGSQLPYFSTNVRKSMENCKALDLGNEFVDGIDAKRVRMTAFGIKDVNGKTIPPMNVEAVVALEPSFQVLKVTDVNGGMGDLTPEMLKVMFYEAREVQSVRVMNGWLICDKTRMPAVDGKHATVHFENAEPLPAGYVGMWDHKRITGAVFGGDAEKATRASSKRLSWAHTNQLTYVPYTEEEQEKIRKYVLAATQPIQPRSSWPKLLFWIANFMMIGIIGWVGYRIMYRRSH